MIIAVLSDIHSNSWAFEAIVHQARRDFGDQIRFCVLGDCIGYGPRPLECIRMIRELDENNFLYRNQNQPALIGGNHEYIWKWLETDHHVIDRIENIAGEKESDRRFTQATEYTEKLWIRQQEDQDIMTGINIFAMKAIVLNMIAARTDPPLMEWYFTQIEGDGFFNRSFSGAGLNGWSLHLVHGKQEKPLDGELTIAQNYREIWRYFRYICTPLGDQRSIFLHGHTHIPMWYSSDVPRMHDIEYGIERPLNDRMTIINPGSVGLARGEDRRPSYAVLKLLEEGSSVTFFHIDRNEYELASFLDAFRKEKYPDDLIEGF